MGWTGYYDNANDCFVDNWIDLCEELGCPSEEGRTRWEEENKELIARTALARAQPCEHNHVHNEDCCAFERGVFAELANVHTAVGFCMPELAQFIRPIVLSNMKLEMQRMIQGTAEWALPSGRVAALAQTLHVIDATIQCKQHAYKTIDRVLGEEHDADY